MSKYSDKKKKQLELSQMGVDVYSIYHPTIISTKRNDEDNNDSDQKVNKEPEISNEEIMKMVDTYSQEEMSLDIIKHNIDSFKVGPQAFIVSYQATETEKRVFRVFGYDESDVREKIDFLHLKGVSICIPEKYKISIDYDKMPNEVKGISATKFDEVMSENLFQQMQNGEREYVVKYNDKQNTNRFGTIKANNAKDAFDKFRIIKINPMKVYQQCFKGE